MKVNHDYDNNLSKKILSVQILINYCDGRLSKSETTNMLRYLKENYNGRSHINEFMSEDDGLSSFIANPARKLFIWSEHDNHRFSWGRLKFSNRVEPLLGHLIPLLGGANTDLDSVFKIVLGALLKILENLQLHESSKKI